MFLALCIYLLCSANLRKRSRRQRNFITKPNVVLTWPDPMGRQYSVKAGTRRWPVAIFYNILDMTSINAFVIHRKQTEDKVSRRDFLFKVATELREDYIVEKSSRNATTAIAHTLSTAPKKLKPRSVNSVK